MAQMPEDFAENIPSVTGIPLRKVQKRTLSHPIMSGFIVTQVIDLETVAGD